MTGLFNLRTRLALFASVLVITALGSVYGLAYRLADELNHSGFRQNLGAIENRVLGSWSRERELLLGKLNQTVYDPANTAQLRAGGTQDLLMRMTLTLGAKRAWVMDSDLNVVAQAGDGDNVSASQDTIDLARRALSSGNAEGLVALGDRASLVAAVRLRDGPRDRVMFISRPVDTSLARTMTELTGAQVGFFKFSTDKKVTVLGAQMDPETQQAVTEVVRGVAARGVQTARDLALGDLRFRLTLVHQSPEGDVYAGILPGVRPVVDKVTSFLYAVGLIAAGALVLALIGGLVLGQRLTGALVDLTHAARQISNGRYDIDLHARSSDVLGRFVESFKLLAQSLKQREAKLFRTAHRDTVTGLPSRALFENELVDAVGKARGRGDSLALITVVVDRLREVNDSLGRKASDSMLSSIGDRLRRTLKIAAKTEGGTQIPGFIARLATYEFGIILPECDQEQAFAVANKLTQVLARRVEYEGQSVLPGGRVGIACFPDHGMDPGSLLYSADIAATHAQERLNSVALFDPSFEAAREQQLAMLGELRDALDRGELYVAMQPKISLQKSGVLMAEALMRWEHPERGPQNPSEFVPFAEKTGFITKLTNWMIDAALTIAAQYHQKGIPLSVSVNLSPRDLGSPDFTTFVVERLRAHKLRGSALTFEVTEQAVVNAGPVVRQNLDVLWRLGVKIAIDDFGSGFASLEQLRALPLSYLKVDRQYVSGLVSDEASRIVVKSAIELGHAIGVEVVAEGVETTEQLEALRTLNCDQAQGYFVGKPLAHDDFEAWVQTRSASFDVGSAGRGSGRKSGGKAALAAAAAAAASGQSAAEKPTVEVETPELAVAQAPVPEIIEAPSLEGAIEGLALGDSVDLAGAIDLSVELAVAEPATDEGLSFDFDLSDDLPATPGTPELSLDFSDDSADDAVPPLSFDLSELESKG